MDGGMTDAHAAGVQAGPYSMGVKSEASFAGSPIVQQLHSGRDRNVQFVSVYGHDPDKDAFCSILRIEGFTILLDCGWTEACDPALVAPLQAVAPEVDLVSVTLFTSRVKPLKGGAPDSGLLAVSDDEGGSISRTCLDNHAVVETITYLLG
jgi:hypothetical protein